MRFTDSIPGKDKTLLLKEVIQVIMFVNTVTRILMPISFVNDNPVVI